MPKDYRKGSGSIITNLVREFLKVWFAKVAARAAFWSRTPVNYHTCAKTWASIELYHSSFVFIYFELFYMPNFIKPKAQIATMYSKIPDAARSMKLTMRTPAWKKPKADTPIEGHTLADPETSVPTGSTHPFSRKSSPRMSQNDTQPAAPTYRIVSCIEVPWPETAHERFHAAESILSRPDCNLSPIGERAWRKYRTAVEGWIQSWKPRYWAYCFDPGYAEDFFHINPEQLDCVQRRCYNIIAEHDRHRVSRMAFIQALTKEQTTIMNQYPVPV